jgi:hypothetical protein
MANQTAIEWLEDKINNYDFNQGMAQMRKYILQAKQMEKQQTLDFASKVLTRAECSWTGIVHINESLEDIYNEINSKDGK